MPCSSGSIVASTAASTHASSACARTRAVSASGSTTLPLAMFALVRLRLRLRKCRGAERKRGHERKDGLAHHGVLISGLWVDDPRHAGCLRPAAHRAAYEADELAPPHGPPPISLPVEPPEIC